MNEAVFAWGGGSVEMSRFRKDSSAAGLSSPKAACKSGTPSPLNLKPDKRERGEARGRWTKVSSATEQRQSPTQRAARAYHLPRIYTALVLQRSRAYVAPCPRSESPPSGINVSTTRSACETLPCQISRRFPTLSRPLTFWLAICLSSKPPSGCVAETGGESGTAASVIVPSLAVGSEFQEQWPPNRVKSAPNRRAAGRPIRRATRRAGAAAATS